MTDIRVVLDPWPLNLSLTAYDGGGRRLAPERAYAGMPPDARLAAAVCDAAINDQWGWVSSMVMVIMGEKQPTTSTRTQRYFDQHGWRDVEDVYEAARVTKAQRTAFNLHMHNFTHREIGELMDTTPHAAQMQVIRTLEKLKRLMDHHTDISDVEDDD